MGKKKTLKSLIRFHSANKLDNYNAMGHGEGGREEKEKKDKKRKNSKETAEQVKTVQQKYSRLTQWTEEIKNFIYHLRTKLTKAQIGKQN